MYLGRDVSKDSLDCFKLVETSADKQFKNDKQGVNKLLDWLGHDDCHVVMEATGVYWQRCAFALHEKGIRLSVVNPAQVKYFAQSTLRRGKTDNMDACLLANYAATMQPELWQPKPVVFEELKLLVRERDDLTKQLTQLYNQLHAHQHRQHCPNSLTELINQRIELFKCQRKLLEKTIEKHCLENMATDYECLRSIPGVGPVTASVLLAETSGLASFDHPKQLTAFAGIAPAPSQSGTFNGQAHISKIGNPQLRKAFYMAAMQARHHAVFQVFYQRLIKRGKKPKLALVALARKLMVIAFTLIKTKQLFDPDYLSKKTLTS